jgi:aryl-alcohol dehydrogenase-like predicted oxidoreductase
MANPLPQTLLGRTGLCVTRLGIGGAYCETSEGYQAALDCGVDYVDTARAYRDGQDEEVIGRALKGRRHQLVLATKTAQRDAEGARKDLETSLRLLQTDYLDIWQIHHLNTQEEREKALGPGGAMEAVEKARKEGLVRFVGVTGHDWAQIQAAVATGLFDTVLCWYNCAMREPEQTVLPEAQKHHTGVVIMNASRNTKLFGGEGAPAPAQFYRYVLGHPAVGLTVMGLRDVAVFRQVSEALARSLEISPEEKAGLERYGAALRAAGKLD